MAVIDSVAMPIKAVLLDLEGVLYHGEAPIDGAIAAVARPEAMGLGLRQWPWPAHGGWCTWPLTAPLRG